MNSGGKIGIVIGLLVVIAITLAVKQRNQISPVENTTGLAQPASATVPVLASQPATRSSDAPAASRPAEVKPLPRLVDLGAGKCIPCKKMAPILEELKKEYAGRLHVEFIDVWQNEKAGEKYGIQMIPTQIFFDAAGQERFRHEGFFSKDDILAKWKELGVDLKGAR